MTPNTWGIPGPTFLVLYLAAIIVVAVAATVHRRSLFKGDSRLDVERLAPEKIAYLNGRDRLAVYTSMGALRAAEAIGGGAAPSNRPATTPDRTEGTPSNRPATTPNRTKGKILVQTGQLPAGATALDSAVYHAAGRQIRAREIVSDGWVVSALADLRADLERNGLATTSEQRRTARLWAIPAGALVLLGIARLIDGIDNGKPVGFLLLSLVVAIVVTIVVVAAGSSVRTRAATRGLSTLRASHQYLSPRQSPSYATYGVGGAALGVALFGGASLYAMDPAFAAEAEIAKGSSGYDGSSGWVGGSSSCGGGGGGGGGCGGGGCGG